MDISEGMKGSWDRCDTPAMSLATGLNVLKTASDLAKLIRERLGAQDVNRQR